MLVAVYYKGHQNTLQRIFLRNYFFELDKF